MELKIIDVKDERLKTPSKEIKKIDKKIIKLIADLRETLMLQKDPEGVGLAAPQVGKNIRLFLINYNGIEHIVINPEIVKIAALDLSKTKKRSSILEGCLSLPHYYSPIRRAKSLVLRYKDETGKEITREFKGFLAHIVQHEVDHLNGKLFIDRVFEQTAPLYKFHGDDYEEVELK